MEFVKVVEVSPRDGLQNEKEMIPTSVKIDFINQLSDTGLSVIEATSFVSPKWIPQLADHREVYEGIHKRANIRYPVLIFNKQGLENAIEDGVKDIAVFTTPSEAFCRRNANCTVSESLLRIQELNTIALKKHIRVRGYISCVLGCPFDGEISPEKVAIVADKLLAFGCDEISLGDTIGVGTPGNVEILLKSVTKNIPCEKIAVHFHDTYGQALANIYAALQNGIRIIDSSVAGLGGCPYAKGATGNVATEDVLYLLNGLKFRTNVDLDKVISSGRFISKYLQRENRSKVSLAFMGKNND